MTNPRNYKKNWKGDWGEINSIQTIAYDFSTRTGDVQAAKGCYVDMKSTIDVFLAIDPRVTSIRNFAGGILDTVYQKQGEKWEAYRAVVVDG